MSAGPALPTVTVGIPLYRSRPYVDIIRDNLQQLTYPNLDVIVSDRHGLDDAIDLLEREFAADARVAFHRASDGVGWVAHFNYLMHAATGEYFVWMQHDDAFPARYVDTLVNAAQRVDGCLIAFGGMTPAWIDASEHQALVPVGEYCGPDRWTRLSAHRLLFSGWVGVPFRGAIHRARALAAAGDLRDTTRGFAAEHAWIYALALTGPLVYAPDTACIKRFHAASATRQLRPSPSMFWAGVRAFPDYLARLPLLRRIEGRGLFSPFALLRIAYHSGLKRVASRRMATAARDALYRAVNW